MSFGGSLEVEPELPEAERLLAWYRDTYKPLNPSSAPVKKGSSFKNDANAAATTIGEMKLDFTGPGSGSGSGENSYYTLECHVTSLNTDTFAYKACPSDGCNKKVEERSPGEFYCAKCRLGTGGNFDYRYLDLTCASKLKMC